MFAIQDSLSPRVCQDKVIKTILLGDAGVGKTSLFWRIKEEENCLEDSAAYSANTDMYTKRIVTPNNGTILMNIWDTAGAERYRTLTLSYYRFVSAVILVYNANNPASLNNLALWIEEARSCTSPNTVLVLVGNETSDENIVTTQTGDEFAASHNISVHIRLSVRNDAQEKVTNILKHVVAEVLQTNHTKRDRSISLHSHYSVHQQDKVKCACSKC